MPRIIDAEKIALTSSSLIDEDGNFYVSLADVRKAIAQTPTEDVVDVVRCKDCKHGRETKYGFYVCSNEEERFAHDEMHYCSYGKRKEQA